ncbi:hypothetical protein CgunFtcFv8_024945 [Champsocephalus gunnari]|uniref:Uncharacterized protein n=1 Tax=Champsocephalus gunnari TaxID=52237 RepID=A0AAN8DFI3_CHAGU|nr:hypothetical protein CgunFtcFv8_024945 [Champsocephalus gunnari]
MDPADYPMQPWAAHYPGPPQAPQGYPQSPSYPNPNSQSAPSYPGYPPGQPYPRQVDPRGVDPRGVDPRGVDPRGVDPRGVDPRPFDPRGVDPRGVDPGYHPHPSSQQRGPLRQDVPPSPTPPLRGLRYDTMTRATTGGGYRHMVDPGPDQYGYPGEGGRQQHQNQTNPRQKNAMTAAV